MNRVPTSDRPRCYFIDIDGCVLRHLGTLPECLQGPGEALPGVVELLDQLHQAGHRIVLVTGRPESARSDTECQLNNADVIYDRLVMDCGGGVRILVNDMKPDWRNTAHALSVERNGDWAMNFLRDWRDPK